MAALAILVFTFLTCQIANCQYYEDTDSSYTDTDPSYGSGNYYHGPSPHETTHDRSRYPSQGNYGYNKNKIDCGPLPDPKNGKVEIVPDTKKASIATYICDEGFILYGKSERVCTSYGYGGRWSGKAPKCIPIVCGGLPGIENGRVILSGIGFRDTATYLCKLGFDLIGNRQRKCQEDAEWSGEEPMCAKITCPKLTPPENGGLFVTGRFPNDLARYSCKYGFYLDGQKQRECQRTGEWSGTDPTCKKIEPIGKKAPPPSYTPHPQEPSYNRHPDPSYEDSEDRYEDIDDDYRRKHQPYDY